MILPRYQLFNNDWLTLGCFFILIFTAIAFSEVLKQKLSWPIERSRKFVHVIVGLMVSVSPLIFTTNTQPAVIAVLFILINGAALKSNRFQAMHATERKSFGTIYFPLAYLTLALFWWDRPVSLMIGTLLMTFSDTIASTIGNSVRNPRRYRLWSDNKSLEGSIGMFLSSWIIVFLVTWWSRRYLPVFLLPVQIISISGIVALLATAAESISKFGSDNYSVPVVSALLYDLYIAAIFDNSEIYFVSWLFLSLALFFLAYRFKSLSTSGSVGAYLMGAIIFGTGGLKWVIPLVIFFVFSSLISKLGKGKNTATDKSGWQSYQKGSRRDVLQVFANGGIATLVAVTAFYQPNEILYIMFLGSVAAATADTWATEIGFFSRNKPRHIISFKAVDKGTSGGVSVVGTIGTIIGSLLIGTTGVVFGLGLKSVLIVTSAGVIGSLVDSIIGGTVQARFRCPVCDNHTEKHLHCKSPTTHVDGLRWIDNDLVNVTCTLSGALAVLLIF